MSFDAKKFCQTYVDCWAEAMGNLEDKYRESTLKKLYTSKKNEDDADKSNRESLTKKWTDFHMERILYPFAEKLGYKRQTCSSCDISKSNFNYKCNNSKCGYYSTWQKEYYKVDFSLYTHSEENEPVWCVDYYIEHENAHFILNENKYQSAHKGWLDEFNKLLPLKCSDTGARVIISYADLEESNLSSIVEYLKSNLKNDIIKQSLVERPILIILAPSNSYIKKHERSAEFTFILFEHNSDGWKCLVNRRNISCATFDEGLSNINQDAVRDIFHKLYS